METPLDDNTPQTPQKPAPMPLGKTLLINMGIMLVYMVLSGAGKGEAGLGNLIIDSMLLLVQVGLNLLVGLILLFSPEQRNVGASMMISAIVVAIIGFGACIGKAAIADSL